MSEISERTAGLNTQMRFGNYRKALGMAYGLRLDLQLTHPTNVKVQQELENVEAVIDSLERLKISKYQRLAQRFWESIVESFQPSSSAAPPAEEAPVAEEDVAPAAVEPQETPPVARKTEPMMLGEGTFEDSYSQGGSL